MPKANPETPIVKAICKMLNKEGYMITRINSGARSVNQGKRFIWFSMWLDIITGKWRRKGTSDILACSRKGRYIAIEVKVPGKEPTTEQYDYLEQVKWNNGVGIWATSAEDAEQQLKELGEL